jgi:hypothetical protein
VSGTVSLSAEMSGATARAPWILERASTAFTWSSHLPWEKARSSSIVLEMRGFAVNSGPLQRGHVG